MTGTNCDLFTHNQSRSYLNHLVYTEVKKRMNAFYATDSQSEFCRKFEKIQSRLQNGLKAISSL